MDDGIFMEMMKKKRSGYKIATIKLKLKRKTTDRKKNAHFNLDISSYRTFLFFSWFECLVWNISHPLSLSFSFFSLNIVANNSQKCISQKFYLNRLSNEKRKETVA